MPWGRRHDGAFVRRLHHVGALLLSWRHSGAPSWRKAREGAWGGERDDENCTTYWFPGKHVAVAWLCLWAIRPTATILRVFIPVPGHQISRR